MSFPTAFSLPASRSLTAIVFFWLPGVYPALGVGYTEQISKMLESDVSMSDGVLLTGATGFVGMELLARYLERTDRRVYALVRGASEREVVARVERTLLCLFGADHPYAERVVAVRGDITRPGLGLGSRRDRLAERVSEVVHGAASVSFELGLEDLRQINVEGTRRVLEFAERAEARGGLRRFSYISTAYVAGEHAGCFSEDELDVGQCFRNAYEQSKFEAECLLTRARRRLPSDGAAPEHHRRRARQWLDAIVQRALLAVAGVFTRRLRRVARAPRRSGRRGFSRLRRRCDLRAQPGPGGRGRHLPPDRGGECDQRR